MDPVHTVATFTEVLGAALEAVTDERKREHADITRPTAEQTEAFLTVRCVLEVLVLICRSMSDRPSAGLGISSTCCAGRAINRASATYIPTALCVRHADGV